MQGEYCGNLFSFNLESVTNHITLTLEIGELRRNLPRYLTLQLLYEGRGKLTVSNYPTLSKISAVTF